MLEDKIKKIIIEKYGSIRQFALKIDVPYTTIDSILKRGIDNSNVNNVIKICKELNLSVDKTLEANNLVSNLQLDNATNNVIENANENTKKYITDNGIEIYVPVDTDITADDILDIQDVLNDIRQGKYDQKN